MKDLTQGTIYVTTQEMSSSLCGNANIITERIISLKKREKRLQASSRIKAQFSQGKCLAFL